MQWICNLLTTVQFSNCNDYNIKMFNQYMGLNTLFYAFVCMYLCVCQRNNIWPGKILIKFQRKSEAQKVDQLQHNSCYNQLCGNSCYDERGHNSHCYNQVIICFMFANNGPTKLSSTFMDLLFPPRKQNMIKIIRWVSTSRFHKFCLSVCVCVPRLVY